MSKAPKWFVPVAVLAFIWNLLGCLAFAFDLMASPEDIAQLSEAEQAIYAARPVWSVVGTGMAVILGALGSLGLILKKSWSLPLLALSLIGVILQDISLFLLSGAGAMIGVTVYVLQGLVLIISVLLVLMALRGKQNNWLG
ncbi:MAG: hypothetical protein DWQ47_16475 [Acidobacteria bacterium]|nr:MAG: hypothetical protein DWQ32_03875 [Acidobacteriota bacterium]REK03134.1 MAG: hypothetical protein DWQ38_08265 [Acidobacteriota bacterium]REK15411.1 MAG: hypothetical protein DWQ43_09565 [Acidobacteriota bacterium]REK42129.1 MAG: hypothetical protein DWQ47_16475 [Acidobacteriota bacterium]